MAATLHTFMEIFQPFEEDQKTVTLDSIVIPIIQRDYAQGRKGTDVTRIRERFLESLYKAVTEKPITLDFVYGDIDETRKMVPLDGQQRLTTLFLLHWYAAKKANVPEAEYGFLYKFSYDTRYSARNFCHDLVGYQPMFKDVSTSKEIALSSEIINQVWFPLDWKNDPTISSMLVMLDAIDNKFKNVSELWNRLKERCITFYFLPIKDMGLTDGLYITMNSRGKPLTMFEHLKAELERSIRHVDDQLAKDIIKKIDGDWTDLFWAYCNRDENSSDSNTIDVAFLRYFKFICDIISYQHGESRVGTSDDVFDLLEKHFSSEAQKIRENVDTMERFLDCWCDIKGYDSPTSFLDSIMGQHHECGKIIFDTRSNLNIFEESLRSYSETNGFSQQRTVLLYAIIVYLQNIDEVEESDFRRRIRIVNNLIQNSEDEIRDRTDSNRIPEILKQIDSIIRGGNIDDSIPNNFNVNQLAEEREKMNLLKNHPDMADVLFELEDHPLLKGQISIVGVKNLLVHPEYAKRFTSLFSCDRNKVDCAMMATGNYGQKESTKDRYQYGSTLDSAWNALFHKSSNEGFNKTSEILVRLLAMHDEFSDETLQEVAERYLQECERDSQYSLRYYYIKYDAYRPQKYGKMYNPVAETEPYMFLVMQTETRLSQNTYMPFLKIVSDSHLSKDDMGRSLIYGDKHIICENSSYSIRSNEYDTEVDKINIPQNDEGIDTENRVELLEKYIKENFLEN